MMDFLKKRFRGIFYPPGTTPMKWKVHFILFLCLLSSAISITILFPFLPAMVKSFGLSDEETGYHAGLIASAMFVGRTTISYFWGWCSDRFGRRAVMLINLAGLTASMAAFGLSFSLKMAIITRLFVGLTNGCVAIIKAVIFEVCDETNQSMGMSVMMTSWNFGLIVGPALGGFLAEPSEKYPDVFPKGSFLDRFPFFLPCLLNSVLSFVACMMAYFYLPETGIKRKSEELTETPESSVLMETQHESSMQNLLLESDKNHGLVENQQEKTAIELHICEGNRTVNRHQGGCRPYRNQQRTGKGCLCCRNTNISRLFRNRISMLAIAVYCLFSMVIIGFDELFALWAATDPSLGGLGFSTDHIGTALLCVVVPLLLLQICVFPKLERRLGALRVFNLSCVVIGIAIFAMPSINTFYNRSAVLWSLLLLLLLPIKLCVGCAFGSTAIFINNSVSPDLLGSVNGLAMTLTSVSRALAPVIGGSTFAWSISEGFKLGFPLDEHFAFIVFAAVCMVSLLLSCLLPKHLNQRKTVRETIVPETSVRETTVRETTV